MDNTLLSIQEKKRQLEAEMLALKQQEHQLIMQARRDHILSLKQAIEDLRADYAEKGITNADLGWNFFIENRVNSIPTEKKTRKPQTPSSLVIFANDTVTDIAFKAQRGKNAKEANRAEYAKNQGNLVVPLRLTNNSVKDAQIKKTAFKHSLGMTPSLTLERYNYVLTGLNMSPLTEKQAQEVMKED